VQRLVEFQQCLMPAPLYGADRHVKQRRSIRLTQSLIKEQVDDFAFLLRKALDLGVELAPFRQVARLKSAIRFVGRDGLSAASMVGPLTFRPVIVPCQIDQLPANLLRGQGQEFARGAWLDVFECACQLEQRSLEDIVGLYPTLHGRMALQHLPREPLQSGAEMAEQLIESAGISRAHPLEPILQLQGFRGGNSHAAPLPFADIAFSTIPARAVKTTFLDSVSCQRQCFRLEERGKSAPVRNR